MLVLPQVRHPQSTTVHWPGCNHCHHWVWDRVEIIINLHATKERHRKTWWEKEKSNRKVIGQYFSKIQVWSDKTDYTWLHIQCRKKFLPRFFQFDVRQSDCNLFRIWVGHLNPHPFTVFTLGIWDSRSSVPESSKQKLRRAKLDRSAGGILFINCFSPEI